MSVPIHWRVPPEANLIWRRWPGEDEYVFYHGAAGDTHRLSELAGMIMERILAGGGDRDALTQWLRELGDETPDDTLQTLLASLAGLDFIEPVDAAF